MIDDESRGRDDMRDSASRSERRANDLAVQLDEARVALEQAERARKLAQNEKAENADRVAELQAMYNNVSNAKRKAEGDYHALQEEVEELENEAKAAEEKAQRAMAEVARLMSELNGAQENVSGAEKSRSLLQKQVADLQARLEEAERESGKGLRSQIRKLEQRVSHSVGSEKPEVATGDFYKKGVLKNFAKFTGKHLCWSLFVIKFSL